MTLVVPYVIEGYIYDSNGSPVNGVTVSATDSTAPQGTGTGTTNASGQYYIDLMNYATDGDTIRVFCSSSGEFNDTTFTLNTSHGFKNIDITLARGSNNLSLDAYLKSISKNDFALNSKLFSTTLSNFVLNGVIKAVEDKTFDLNTYLMSAQIDVDTALNTILNTITAKNMALNSKMFNKTTTDFHLNSILEGTGATTNFALNTMLAGFGYKKDTALNSVILALTTTNIALNSVLHAISAENFDLNSVLKSIDKKDMSANSVLYNILKKDIHLNSILVDIGTNNFAFNSYVGIIVTYLSNLGFNAILYVDPPIKSYIQEIVIDRTIEGYTPNADVIMETIPSVEYEGHT